MSISREKHRRKKKEKYYWQLSRRKQRENYIRFRQRIRDLSAIYGGQYISPHYIDEPAQSPEENQWADIYFLGSDKVTVWNATILTAANAFWGNVETIVIRKLSELLPSDEIDAEFRRLNRYENRNKPPTKYEMLGGLAIMDYLDKAEEEIILNDPPVIYELFSTDRTYYDGIGLHMIINVSEINRLTIEDAIYRFRQIGETDWKAAEPVPRNQLPMVRQSYSLSSMSRQIRF